MHEFNDGLRPNYDFVFDEAINHTVDGKVLAPHHELAIKRYTKQASENPLAIGKTFVLQQG